MGGTILQLGVQYKQLVSLLVFAYIVVNLVAVSSTSRQLFDVRKRIEHQKRFAIRSIQSEDGDIIDCIDIYKQPAFDHPALKNHKIQMVPNIEQATEVEAVTNKTTRKQELKLIPTYQQWRRNGSCPMGTIPVRRIRERELRKFKSIEQYGRKGPSFPYPYKKPSDKADSYFLQVNRSYAMLITEGYNYNGAKADIKVWTPKVEHDDEYSTSRIALKNGPYNDYESVESGWMVNPSVYGDKESRLYTYWTVDGSNSTGCFDLTCPGFIQTTNEIALGGVIRQIPVPGGLPWIMTLYIVKDVNTNNWWLQYQDINIGYWPGEIFEVLGITAQTVQWGGEVYSQRLGHPGHTGTGMGSGQFPDFAFQTSGWTKKMRIRDNSMVLKYPGWVYPYKDDYRCYDAYLRWEFMTDPEFYFGGPGRSWLCT